jgi:hypothetical protein
MSPFGIVNHGPCPYTNRLCSFMRNTSLEKGHRSEPSRFSRLSNRRSRPAYIADEPEQLVSYRCPAGSVRPIDARNSVSERACFRRLHDAHAGTIFEAA